MHTSIALLRGINVGGKNLLPMKELVRDLESLDLKAVRTHIQSGNIIFETARKPSRALAGKIADAIEARHGFRPHVLVLGADRLKALIELNPFPEAAREPKSLHVFFLAAAPVSPDTKSLAKIAARSERFHLADEAFYLHAPDGIGRSKLAASVERLLGVAATCRNWNTMTKLLEMAEASAR